MNAGDKLSQGEIAVIEPEKNENVVLALPKGRILTEVMPIVRKTGIEPEPAFHDPGARQLRFSTNISGRMGWLYTRRCFYCNKCTTRKLAT